MKLFYLFLFFFIKLENIKKVYNIYTKDNNLFLKIKFVALDGKFDYIFKNIKI